MTEYIQGYKRSKEIKRNSKKKVKILSIILMCICLLSGCGFDNGSGQFTQLDTKYLSDAPSASPHQNDTGDVKVDSTEIPKMESEKVKSDTDGGKKENDSEKKKQDKSSKKNKSNDNISQKKDSSTKTASTKKSSSKKITKKADSTKKKSNEKNSSSQNKQVEKTSATTQPSAEDSDKNTCTISIDCKMILSNMDKLEAAKKNFVPKDGIILKSTKIEIEDGDSIYDILYRVCRNNKIHMEAAYTPAYKTHYVEGINQLYEFDCGDLSGWTFLVNGASVNYGASKYTVKAGDVIQWRYSCNAGRDVNA